MPRRITVCVLLIAYFLIASVHATELTVTFLDVGHGDCALIQAGSDAMLIDTGSAGSWKHVQEALDGKEVDALKYLVLTHPHADHIGNSARILEQYAPETILLPPVAYATKTYNDFLATAQALNTALIYPQVGDTYALSDAQFTIYAPHSVAYANANDWSVVLMLFYAGRAILFTGDVEADAERDMLAYDDIYPLNSDVLKAAHHGADTSTCRAFALAVSAQYAIVSCAASADDAYPSTDTAMTLVETGTTAIYTTSSHGDITLVITDNGEIACHPTIEYTRSP